MFAADIDSKKDEKSDESNSKKEAEKKGKFNNTSMLLILNTVLLVLSTALLFGKNIVILIVQNVQVYDLFVNIMQNLHPVKKKIR